ncbi:hypothetical protein DEU34_2259 [Microbacterium sp. AG1240]|uniref:hypothetical protein n=1 Tax=Microbacterium sp. AG1240 TaxID=2183992 RepID=UPI000EB53383|nr:hypothetical protein [Microbacterium sp. AG1240]RKT33656.1 hypothetical protein DEU34_2259 [Microbacterium sp. AG1240]
MADEYTPTTEEIMRAYRLPTTITDPQRDSETFSDYLQRVAGIEAHVHQMASEAAAHRWLAAHDAQVRADTLCEFANECVVLVPDDLPDDFKRGVDWGADECTRKAREEADRIAGGTSA